MALMRATLTVLSLFTLSLGLLLGFPAAAEDPAFTARLPASVDAAGGTLAIIGDLQQTPGFIRFVRRREDTAAEQQQLFDDLQAHSARLSSLIIVGDLVYTARSKRDWRHFDTLVAPFAAQMPILAAIGNHDYPCYLVRWCRYGVMADRMAERFPWLVPGQAYAVDAGPLRLLFLDSESQIAEQAEWLREELARAAAAYSAALVFVHRPVWSNSIDRGAIGNAELQRHVAPVLRDAAIPVVVFSGHIHGYEHIVRDGVPYFTTAGGGGPRGALANERPGDFYRGPDCPQSDDRPPLRPFNYMLLDTTPERLLLEVRGLCRGDAEVRTLDRIEIPL